MAALPPIAYERYPGAAAASLPRSYRRREPEKTALYQAIQLNLETFLEQARLETSGAGYPPFVEREFRRYLGCGILAANGFARLRCPDCGANKLVAFSCKGRRCPSCWARRMAETAAHLVDRLLPGQVPYRQYVLSFPWPLRFRLAMDRAFLSDMLRVFARTIFAWQRLRGRQLGSAPGKTGQPAAVLMIQRAGGALNINPHPHTIVPDGLFVGDPAPAAREPLFFVELPPPSDADIQQLTRRLARRLSRVARRHLGDDEAEADLIDIDDDDLALMTASSNALRAPVRLPPPRPGLRLEPEAAASSNSSGPASRSLCHAVGGFSLHAATTVAADDRAALERLCRYGLRAPFSLKRFSLLPDGRVRYERPRPWPTPGGATELVLEPLDLLRRLAAIIPTPFTNMVRYYGCFSSHSRFRHRLPSPLPLSLPSPGEVTLDTPQDDPQAGPRDQPRREQLTLPCSTADTSTSSISAVDADSTSATATATAEPAEPAEPGAAAPPLPASARRSRRLSWASLLKRTMNVDALKCKCGTAMVVLAFITDIRVVTRILDHLGLPSSPPPIAPASFGPEPDLFSDLPADEDDQTYLDEPAGPDCFGQKASAPP